MSDGCVGEQRLKRKQAMVSLLATCYRLNLFKSYGTYLSAIFKVSLAVGSIKEQDKKQSFVLFLAFMSGYCFLCGVVLALIYSL